MNQQCTACAGATNMQFMSMRCFTSKNQASFCVSVSQIQFLNAKASLRFSLLAPIVENKHVKRSSQGH